MPSSSFPLRRAGIAAAAALALTLPAAPAGAQLPIPLPCLPGLTCPQEEPQVKPCANEGLVPAAANLRAIRGATLCLLNRERSAQGLSPLRADRRLRRAATRYARQMARRDFFDHVSPTGSTFVERIRTTSYLTGADGYDIGENLAWGGGPLATPQQVVSGWMASPGHRANILKAEFRDVGIGVALGIPVPGLGVGATYVNEFGRRG